jgi:hypothetical protein
VNPLHAIPESSINRSIIGDDCPLKEFRGIAGRDLLSSRVLEPLRREGASGRADYPGETGRRIAALLFSLFTGSARWPAPPPEAADALDRISRAWQTCPRVLLGGGYLAGDDGAGAAARAQEILGELGLGDREVRLFRQPGEMPLYGAAAGCAAGTLVIDFGHTSAKAVVLPPEHAGTADGELDGLGRWPMKINAAHEGWDMEFALEVKAKLRGALGEFRRLYLCRFDSDPPAVAISLAAYLDDGVFVENHRGGFCKLRMIDPDFNALVSVIWQELGGPDLPVQSWHDGTAAARNLPEPGAALVFGTAVGHGFNRYP